MKLFKYLFIITLGVMMFSCKKDSNPNEYQIVLRSLRDSIKVEQVGVGTFTLKSKDGYLKQTHDELYEIHTFIVTQYSFGIPQDQYPLYLAAICPPNLTFLMNKREISENVFEYKIAVGRPDDRNN